MEDVNLAQLGVQKAVHPDVKAYAEMIVTDHTASRANLMILASTRGLDLSDDMEYEPTRTHRNLEKTDREDFDRKFLDRMVDDHKKQIGDYEDAAEDAKDAQVKAFAAERLPMLRAHHEKAEALRTQEIERTTDKDNTGRNVRDRDDKALTSFDQGSGKRDTEITADIRKAILDVDDMSTNGKNVKIITKDGKVTLRGPVNSAGEKRIIDEIAGRIAHAGQVDSQLEVK